MYGTCPFAHLQLSVISPGFIFPFSWEVMNVSFFCSRFTPLLFLLVPLIGTLIVRIGLGFPWPPKFLHLSSFAFVNAALGFFNKTILDAMKTLFQVYLPQVRSASHGGLPSVLPSQAKKRIYCHCPGYGCCPEWTELNKRASAVSWYTLRYTRRSSWRRYVSSLQMNVSLSVVWSRV